MTKRLTWQDLEIYTNKKYKGLDPQDNKHKTIKIIDCTLGGDLIIYRRIYGRDKWKQERFLQFLKKAKEIIK